jgi:HEAT repeat protein
MRDGYEPRSEFLKAIIAEKLPLSGGELAEANLRRLILMMRDEDRSNRDWATFLLAQEETDTPAVRDALISSAKDGDEVVRAEAVLGLAKRDPLLALPLVQEALRSEAVAVPMLEAAALCAHPSLIPDLRIWAEPSDEPFIDRLAASALAACERIAAA